jgi:glycosyltransferase involved in cell wall biosynthesis
MSVANRAHVKRSATLVSAIIPAYNTERYLERAIRSALGQTHRELEVLVVDDGSTDRTREVAEDYAKKDSRVRVWSQPNAGVSHARNAAMRRAAGEVFALLDSDDAWMPDYLETQVGVLERCPDIAAVSANVVNMGGRKDGESYWPVSDAVVRLSFLDLIEREDSVCIMCVFRRSMYETIGTFDETFTKGNEDYEYWLRAAASGLVFAQVRRPLAYYQRRPESLSAVELNMLRGICAALRKASMLCDAKRLSTERNAIERRIAHFERVRLRVEAGLALRSGDFATAADRFALLHRRQGGLRFACVAAWSRYAPASLKWVDGVRRSLRAPLRT